MLTTEIRAKRIRYADWTLDLTTQRGPAAATFALVPMADITDQLPASYLLSLIPWPSKHVQGDFVRTTASTASAHHPAPFAAI